VGLDLRNFLYSSDSQQKTNVFRTDEFSKTRVRSTYFIDFAAKTKRARFLKRFSFGLLLLVLFYSVSVILSKN